MEDHLCVPHRQVEPFFISHENYYDHLLASLRGLDSFMDCFLILDNEECIPVHHFIISAFSQHINSFPKQLSSTSYILLRDLNPSMVHCVIGYIYTGTTCILRHNLHDMNRILHVLNISLGCENYENVDTVQFTVSQAIKHEVINKIWHSRNQNCDVKFITKEMHESFAHSPILAACSDYFLDCCKVRGVHNKLIVIVIREFSLEILERVLEFCYTGQVEIPIGSESSVYQLAKQLGIKDLYSTFNNIELDRITDSSSKTVTRITSITHKEVMSLQFRTLVENETLSDIQLINSDHRFKVHSAILCMSPYFKTIFELREMKNALVFLSEYSLETVRAFIDYLYHGEVVYSGCVEDFTSAMQGLIDFSLLPVTSAEEMQTSPCWNNPQALNELWSQESCKPEYPCVESQGTSPIETKENAETSSKIEEEKLQIEKTETVIKGANIPLINAIANESSKETIVNKPFTYTCNTCSATFYSRRSLKLHLNTHPEARVLQCSYCDQTFDRPSLHKVHERIHTGARPFMCIVCGKSFSTPSSLAKHGNIHSGTQVFECALCSRKCSRKDYLEEHIRTHTGSKPYKCQICNKSFVGRTGLNHHRKTHEPKHKDAVCEVCGKAFTRKALWTHMKSHNKQHQCDVCHKYFATPSTLRSHYASIHFVDKIYQCDICGKTFGHQNQMKRHKRSVHGASRTFHCDKCPRVLSSQAKLEAHEKSKHVAPNEKVYACDLCNKRFSGRSAAIYHRRNHTGEKPHICEVCSKSFSRPDALKKHSRCHSGEKPYHCTLCDQRCSSKSALNKHIQRHKNKKNSHDASKNKKSEISFSDQSRKQILSLEKVELAECNVRIPDGSLLQPLESLSVDSGLPQYIQVYVPGPSEAAAETSESSSHGMSTMLQMGTQSSQESGQAQYIQVYVPSGLGDQDPGSYLGQP